MKQESFKTFAAKSERIKKEIDKYTITGKT